jgi:hypothetical protein
MMPRPSSSAIALVPQIGIVALLVLTGLPSQALAQSVIIPDPASSQETAELAAAVSMLVRSSLKVAEHPVVPRRQLALAIEAASGHAPGKDLSIPPTLASKVIEQLGAESVVLWELQLGSKGMQVGGMLVGPGGKRLLRIAASAATGDVAELGRQLARRIAPAIGATVTPLSDFGMADLRPIVQAESALLVQDSVAISRALDLAVPTLGAESSAARPVLQDIAADPGLSALPRAQALLLLGDHATSLERAEAGLASDGKNILLRAAKVRALAGQADFAAAEREIQTIKAARNPSALAVAQVVLGRARGDSPEMMAEALSPLFGRPAVEWRSVLPLIATAAPGTFGARGESAALAAAEKLAQQEPGLASTLAARALVGGAKAQDAAPLIKVQDLSTEQAKSVGAYLGGEGGAVADLGQQIKAREEEAQAIAAAAGPEKPTGPPGILASDLRNVLQDFTALYDPKLTSIAIAPLPGSGQPFYWPYRIRRERLGEGLIEALMRSPWELQATLSKVQTEALPAERFTDEGMAALAHDIVDGAVLFYRVRPSGLAPWVALELVLFDPANQRIEKIETSMVGRSTGLMVPSPLWIGLLVLACVAILVWAVRMSLRGTIVVRVQWDSDAKDEMFSILISRRPQTPTIENVTAYRKKMEWIGKRKRHYEAWNIDQNTTFRGIPRGKWHVHLYGIYTRGRQTLLLKEPPQIAEVQARKTVFVAHVLEAAEAEFKITVVDDHGPVEGARVWLDDERAKAAASAKNGTVTLKVPKGFHVIHVSARGMEVDRPYHVVKAKIHDMTINLVWEKRQEFVSRALERQVDDAAPYMTKAAVKKALPAAIPLPPSPQSAPEPLASPGPAGRPPSTGPIEIRLEDTPVVVAMPAALAPTAQPAPRPAQSVPQPVASQRPSSPKPAVAKPTLTLKPLVPTPPSQKSSEIAIPFSDGGQAGDGDALNLNTADPTDAPVDLPPIDLAATMVPPPERPIPTAPGPRRR